MADRATPGTVARLVETAASAVATLPRGGALALLGLALLSAAADGRHVVLAAAAALVAGAALASGRRETAARVVLGTTAGAAALGAGAVLGLGLDLVRVGAALAGVVVGASVGMRRAASPPARPLLALPEFLAEAQRNSLTVAGVLVAVVAGDAALAGAGEDRVVVTLVTGGFGWLGLWALLARSPSARARRVPILVIVAAAVLSCVAALDDSSGERQAPDVLRITLALLASVPALLLLGLTWILTALRTRSTSAGVSDGVFWVGSAALAIPALIGAPLIAAAMLTLGGPILAEAGARSSRPALRMMAGLVLLFAGACVVGAVASDGGGGTWLGHEGLSPLARRVVSCVRLAEFATMLGALAALSRIAIVQMAIPAGHAALAGAERHPACATVDAAAPRPAEPTDTLSAAAFLSAASDVAGSLDGRLAAGLVAAALVAAACGVPLPLTIVLAAWAGGRSLHGLRSRGVVAVAAAGIAIAASVVAAGALATRLSVWTGRDSLTDRATLGAAALLAALVGAVVHRGAVADPERARARWVASAQIRPWLVARFLAIYSVCEVAIGLTVARDAPLYGWVLALIPAAAAAHLAARASDVLHRFAPIVIVPPAAALAAWIAGSRGRGAFSEATPLLVVALWTCGASVFLAHRAPERLGRRTSPLRWGTLAVCLAAGVLLGGDAGRGFMIVIAPVWIAAAALIAGGGARRVGVFSALALLAGVLGVRAFEPPDWRWFEVLGFSWERTVRWLQSSRAAPWEPPDVPGIVHLAAAVHLAVLVALAAVAATIARLAATHTAIPRDHPVYTEGPAVNRARAAALQ